MILSQSLAAARAAGLDDAVFLTVTPECGLLDALRAQLHSHAQLVRGRDSDFSGWIDRATLEKALQEHLPDNEWAEWPPLARGYFWRLTAERGVLRVSAIRYHQDGEGGEGLRVIGRPQVYPLAVA